MIETGKKFNSCQFDDENERSWELFESLVDIDSEHNYNSESSQSHIDFDDIEHQSYRESLRVQISNNNQNVSFDVLKDVRDSMKSDKIKQINNESTIEEFLANHQEHNKNKSNSSSFSC